jgi:hypothetical protein
MKYRLIQLVDGQWLKTELHHDNVIPAMECRGFEFTGLHQNPRTRKELQGAPKFMGVNGPMWDGDGIRYETREAYAALSE